MSHLTDEDTAFASAMIKHHQMALKMSIAYIEDGTNEKLLDLAEKIIRAQTSEIDMMTKLLKK